MILVTPSRVPAIAEDALHYAGKISYDERARRLQAIDDLEVDEYEAKLEERRQQREDDAEQVHSEVAEVWGESISEAFRSG